MRWIVKPPKEYITIFPIIPITCKLGPEKEATGLKVEHKYRIWLEPVRCYDKDRNYWEWRIETVWGKKNSFDYHGQYFRKRYDFYKLFRQILGWTLALGIPIVFSVWAAMSFH